MIIDIEYLSIYLPIYSYPVLPGLVSSYPIPSRPWNGNLSIY